MQKKSNKSVTRQTLKIFWQETLDHKKYFIAVSILAPIGIVINSYLSPYIISEIINKIQATNIPTNELMNEFGPTVLFFAIAWIISEGIVWRAMIWLIWKMEEKVYMSLYEKAFSTLINQSMSFHSDKMSGSLVSNARNFANSYTNFMDTNFFSLLRIIVAIIVISLVLGPKMPAYTLGLFVLSAIFCTFAVVGFKGISKAQIKTVEEHSKLGGKLADSISNILAVKSNSRERYEKSRINSQGKIAYNAEMVLAKKYTLRDFGFGTVLALINILFLICLIFGKDWFGVTIGTLILAMSYSNQLVMQLWDVTRILRNYSRIFGDAHEMTKILTEEVSVIDEKSAKNLVVSSGSIKLQNVKFTHDDKKRPLFKDFNLHVKAGERVGLVGQSGSGKSTLTKLLLRFSDVEEGEILIDGQNISKIKQKSLRENISYVPQEAALFHRSVAENIAYGKPGANESEIIEAAKLANAWEFIQELPDGLKTKTGERGVMLSGGQRQRVAIARAILKNAPILILDEATSALDTESEKLIQGALDNLMKNRTSVVIAHRLSTVRNLDRIVVMQNGKIVESGNHKELLKLDQTYAKLWNIQAGE